MPLQYGPADLEAQLRVKDVFDPRWLLNPAKVFPLRERPTRRGAARGVSAGRAPAERGSELAARSVRDAAAAARRAAGDRTGGGTRGIGHAVDGEPLSTAGLSGITLYEPGRADAGGARRHAARRGRGGAGGRGADAAVRALGRAAADRRATACRRSAAWSRSTPPGRGGSRPAPAATA